MASFFCFFLKYQHTPSLPKCTVYTIPLPFIFIWAHIRYNHAAAPKTVPDHRGRCDCLTGYPYSRVLAKLWDCKVCYFDWFAPSSPASHRPDCLEQISDPADRPNRVVPFFNEVFLYVTDPVKTLHHNAHNDPLYHHEAHRQRGREVFPVR